MRQNADLKLYIPTSHVKKFEREKKKKEGKNWNRKETAWLLRQTKLVCLEFLGQKLRINSRNVWYPFNVCFLEI